MSLCALSQAGLCTLPRLFAPFALGGPGDPVTGPWGDQPDGAPFVARPRVRGFRVDPGECPSGAPALPPTPVLHCTLPLCGPSLVGGLWALGGSACRLRCAPRSCFQLKLPLSGRVSPPARSGRPRPLLPSALGACLSGVFPLRARRAPLWGSFGVPPGAMGFGGRGRGGHAAGGGGAGAGDGQGPRGRAQQGGGGGRRSRSSLSRAARRLRQGAGPVGDLRRELGRV